MSEIISTGNINNQYEIATELRIERKVSWITYSRHFYDVYDSESRQINNINQKNLIWENHWFFPPLVQSWIGEKISSLLLFFLLNFLMCWTEGSSLDQDSWCNNDVTPVSELWLPGSGIYPYPCLSYWNAHGISQNSLVLL